MRNSAKGDLVHSEMSGLFNVDFHEFLEKETECTAFELASEFGLSLRDVRKLKKQLSRS